MQYHTDIEAIASVFSNTMVALKMAFERKRNLQHNNYLDMVSKQYAATGLLDFAWRSVSYYFVFT